MKFIKVPCDFWIAWQPFRLSLLRIESSSFPLVVACMHDFTWIICWSRNKPLPSTLFYGCREYLLSISSLSHPLASSPCQPDWCVIPSFSLFWNEVCGTSLVVQWLRLCFYMQGVQVHSLVRQLGSHMPQDQKTKQKQCCNEFNWRLKKKFFKIIWGLLIY